MKKVIDSFSGEYRFLSNFWLSIITCEGKEYATVEHLYQVEKTFVESEREAIRLMSTPGKAKRLGNKATLRNDWDRVKYGIMKTLVTLKFQIPDLTEKLKATGDSELIEVNHWGDTYWGICHGIGENHLGKILMDVRSKL